jgi:hypothetical protein
VYDIDFDGNDELLLHTSRIQAIVRLDGRAAVCELDAYELGQNFADTLRRHHEHYHARAFEKPATHAAGGDGIASAHDRFHSKHEIAPQDVVPHKDGRALFVDFLAAVPVTEYEPSAVDVLRRDDADASQLFVVQQGAVLIQKRLSVRDGRLRVDYRIESPTPTDFQATLDIAMPCCDGFAGRFVHERRIIGGFGQPVSLEDGQRLTLDDRHMNGSVTVSASHPLAIDAQPYYTVSQSEDGLEKIMQSVTVNLAWPVVAGTHETSITLEIRGGLDERLLGDAASAVEGVPAD